MRWLRKLTRWLLCGLLVAGLALTAWRPAQAGEKNKGAGGGDTGVIAEVFAESEL